MSAENFKPRVLWVTPEAAPYASTGGLAEVAGAMPRSLHAAGWPVALLMPCYTDRCSANEAPEVLRTEPLAVELAGRVFEAEIVHARDASGLELRMLRYDPFFARAGIYAQASRDYPDNHLRFGLLSKAACELAKREGYEVLHLNDWSVALAAVFLATHYRDDPALARVRVLQSIHNLAHPGCFHTSTLGELGLSRELAIWNLLGHRDEVSWLKGGMLLADGLHTVSRRYATEILTPEFGNGMEGLLRLRSDRLHGVLNGIDYREWNPHTNKDLVAHYSVTDLRGKARCKRFLARMFDLDARDDAPIIAFLGRMAPQKGLDLLLEVAPGLIAKGVRLVIVGSGQSDLEVGCRELARSYPGAVGVHIGFERSLAQQVTAGADMVVMPSVFEPCGLTQLQALRYGTIPVVHAVGGLVDTVCNVTATTLSSHRATGFVFRKLSARALAMALSRALRHYRDRRAWARLMRNGMRQDFSWESVLPGYASVYRGLFDYDPWRFRFDLPAPGHPAPAEPAPFIDWGPELPDRYHEDTVRLMVQSPTQLYVYWEVAPGRAQSGAIRLVVDRESETWTEARDLHDVGDHWVSAEPDRTYRVRLVGPDGGELLRSNVVRTPRDQPSWRQEARWLEAEERRRRHLEVRRRRALQRGEKVPPWGFDEVEAIARTGKVDRPGTSSDQRGGRR
jgi:starch synthase